MKLIDTPAWVEFLRKQGDPVVKQAVARLIHAELAAYTCPIRFELLSGVRPEEEADLEQTFQFSLDVPFEREDWREAALLERRFRAKALPSYATTSSSRRWRSVPGCRLSAGTPTSMRCASWSVTSSGWSRFSPDISHSFS